MTKIEKDNLNKEIERRLKSYLDDRMPFKDFLDEFGDYPMDDFFSSYNFVFSKIKEEDVEPINNRFEILDL